jgi:hypothetical protein
MFGRTIEYLRYGAGRPLGTMWSMEKAYFDLRRKYPAKEDAMYIKGSLLSRYPDRPPERIHEIARMCDSIEEAMIQAVQLDFGEVLAAQVKFALFNFPECSQCGKHYAISGTSTSCYGCRTYSTFGACAACHLSWNDSTRFCPKCGGVPWKITD